jgi:phosphoglycerol transferase MdoB-like AlkP superfamily enzyme
MNQRKKLIIICFIFMILSLIGFVLIAGSTMNPSQYSGNGNFAILFTLPTVPLYFIFLYYLRRWFFNVTRRLSVKNRLTFLGCLAVVFVVLIFLEVRYIQNLVILLGGGPESPESRIYRFGWYNQYTNTLYFNWITFILGMVLSVIISIGYSLIKKSSNNN